MLLQGHHGKIRVFPVWPRNQPASFGRLRAPGAFLVSGEIRNGEIGPVEIESERGRTCRLVNPWPGRSVVLRRSVGGEERLSGELLEWSTLAGEHDTLRLQYGGEPVRHTLCDVAIGTRWVGIGPGRQIGSRFASGDFEQGLNRRDSATPPSGFFCVP
jgi:hypothetical protein